VALWLVCVCVRVQRLLYRHHCENKEEKVHGSRTARTSSARCCPGARTATTRRGCTVELSKLHATADLCRIERTVLDFCQNNPRALEEDIFHVLACQRTRFHKHDIWYPWPVRNASMQKERERMCMYIYIYIYTSVQTIFLRKPARLEECDLSLQ